METVFKMRGQGREAEVSSWPLGSIGSHCQLFITPCLRWVRHRLMLTPRDFLPTWDQDHF
eukprot:scaffold2914_cov178-Amphora_coffeaeformis.AAC.8